MVRIPEYEKGRSVFPRRTAARKQAVVTQRKGPFRQYAEKFEKKNDSRSPKIDNLNFPQANPKIIYRVNKVKINGDQFPEGVLPTNAIPFGRITFFSRLFSKLGLTRQQK